MSDREPSTGAGFIRAYVLPALLLFAIPVAGYLFAGYANGAWDRQFLEVAEQSINRHPSTKRTRPRSSRTTGRRPRRGSAPTGLPRTRKCGRTFFVEVCGDYKQFGWIRAASVGSLGLGVVSLAVMLVCAGLAFASRELQYASFVAGWNILRVASAIQVLAQGFIAVMLSFWGTVVLTERYFIKLIAIVGIAALVAAFKVIVAIFTRPDDTLTVEGEVITRAASPALWARVDGLCRRLGTQPATHIVGGIDDNFFVTEHPVHLVGHELTGRTLFVSLSLLKRLDKGEADAVLAHEMAHFSGGDTEYSKRTSPLLSRFRTYLGALHEGGLSWPVFNFMLLYWSLVQLALSTSSRAREIRANWLAAEATSPMSMAERALPGGGVFVVPGPCRGQPLQPQQRARPPRHRQPGRRRLHGVRARAAPGVGPVGAVLSASVRQPPAARRAAVGARREPRQHGGGQRRDRGAGRDLVQRESAMRT